MKDGLFVENTPVIPSVDVRRTFLSIPKPDAELCKFALEFTADRFEEVINNIMLFGLTHTNPRASVSLLGKPARW